MTEKDFVYIEKSQDTNGTLFAVDGLENVWYKHANMRDWAMDGWGSIKMNIANCPMRYFVENYKRFAKKQNPHPVDLY